MFFTPDLLCKTGGKFAVIWLAAMKKNRLKRKDYENVDLPEICLELEKLLGPSWKGKMATVEGFSLRLSAQLVHGVSVVYNMKVNFLYKDVNKEYQNLYRQNYTFATNAIQLPQSPNVSAGINLPETSADGQIVDNFLTVDPLFGLPLFVDANISPSLLAPHSFHDLPLPEPPSFNENESGRNMVKDMSTITLKEQADPFTMENEAQKIPEEIDQEVKTLEELGILLPEQDPDQTGNFLSTGVMHEQNIATPKTSNDQAKTPERPKKKKQKEQEVEEEKEKEDETKITEKEQEECMEKEQTEGILFQPPVDEMSRNIFEEAQPILQDPLRPVEQAEEEPKDELVLDPVSTPKPKSAKKKKKKPKKTRQSTNTTALSSASQLKVDEIVQLSTEEMKSHMTDPVISYGNKQFSTPIHLPSAKELFNVPVHWFPVHQPGKHLHFHKGVNEQDEATFPYLEIYRQNCVPIDDNQIIPDDVINREEAPSVPNEQETILAEAPTGAPGEVGEKGLLDETEKGILEEIERGLLDENMPIIDGSALNEVLDPTISVDKDRSDLTNIEQSRMTGNESSVMIQRSANKSSIIHQSRISNISHDKHLSTLGPSSNDPSFAKSALEGNLLESVDISNLLLDPDQPPEVQQLLQPEIGNEFEATSAEAATSGCDVEKKIQMEMVKGNYEMTFSSLLPPSGGATKLDIARSFFDLLMMTKMEKVTLRQLEDFGEITIMPTVSYIG